MKIAIVGAKGKDSMELNLQEAFTHAGHECKVFDIYDLHGVFHKKRIGSYAKTIDKIIRTYNDTYDSKSFIKLASLVNDFNPELVLCTYRIIHPIFVNHIKNKKRKVVHINPDQLTTLGYQQVFASDYDAWFVKDPYMQRFMVSNMKLNAYLYNEAFNKREHAKPNMTKQDCESEINIDVMTYGTVYPYRERMLKSVVDAGVDLKIFGVIPHRFYNHTLDAHFQNKFISGLDKTKLLYGSKIVFNQMHYAEIEGVNCRFFEVNGAGAFQLSDYRPVLNDLLPVDPELVSFRSIDDGIEKIKYYLNHPEERYQISEVIYNHFQNQYSYDNLVSYLIKISFSK